MFLLEMKIMGFGLEFWENDGSDIKMVYCFLKIKYDMNVRNKIFVIFSKF